MDRGRAPNGIGHLMILHFDHCHEILAQTLGVGVG